MNDAQSFYLLLAVFYLIECLASAPSGSRAFMSRGTKGKRWRLRRVAFPVNGFRKEVFLTPFLPWPGMLALTKNQRSSSPLSPRVLRHLVRRAEFLSNSTAPLRSVSLMIFLHFFVLLPLCYYFYARTYVVPAALLYGYLLCLLAAVRFCALHKRYFPEMGNERFKHTLYTAFLPWHAMRAADVIVVRRSAQWDPLVILATDPATPANRRELRRAWNEAVYQSESIPSKGDLESLFEQAGLDVEEFTAPPEIGDDEVYCPICETVYVSSTKQCANCSGVSLKAPVPVKS